jgi:hypothetical protein
VSGLGLSETADPSAAVGMTRVAINVRSPNELAPEDIESFTTSWHCLYVRKCPGFRIGARYESS